jgi:multidrug resistance efflux pump
MTVVWAFDTLGYAKRLREAGVPNPQAEGHAEAAREFIMTELVTRQSLQADLKAGIEPLRAAVDALQVKIDTVETRLEAKIDTQTLRLTVRLGGIVVAGFGIMAVAIGILTLFLRVH